MAKVNSLGIATAGVQWYDGIGTVTGVEGTTAYPLVSNGIGILPSYQILTPAGGGSGTGTAFTTGSVVFAGASGVYSQDNSNFFWDNTNKALGIGTNTPNSGTACKLRLDNTSSSVRTALNVTGTWTTSTGSPRGLHVDANYTPTVGSTCYGVDSDVNFAAPVASTVTGICYQASPSFSGNLGTVTCYGYFYDGGSGLTGTVDFHWGGFFSNPVAGTTKVALYAANMAIGSYNANTPPFNGLIVSGKVGIGTSSPNASDYITVSPSLTASGNAAYILRLTGITLTAAASNDEFNMIRVGAPTLATTTGSFTGLTFYGHRLFGPSKTGNGTFSNAYGYYVGAIATIATNQYGGYFNTPTGGTVNTAIYSDNLAVGYTTPSPPSLGAIISGAVGIGTSAPVSKLDVSGGISVGSYAGVNAAPSNGIVVSGQAIFKTTSSFVGGSVEIGGSDRISFALGGTKTTTDGSAQYGFFLNPTFTPASSTTQVAQIVSYPQFSPGTGVTITTGYNIFLQSGGQAGLGSVTTGYNLYVDNASFGTTQYAASIQGGIVYKYRGTGTSVTLSTVNRIVGVTSTAAARTITLPATVPAAGWRITVKDESGGAATNNITIDGNGHNIDGSATFVINANYGAVDVYSNGTQYYVV